MSEEKICPILSIARGILVYANPTAPCLREECAMWRVEIKDDYWDAGIRYAKFGLGYCGLAGKP